ncbi:Endonuclease III [hydrothermal vent metagenome]|uniref:Endonuclease III n=1 Tax=hydrothermal vent metagenome TaxID=652676 RepID=A0A3B0U9D2_9ZZZZ
MFLKIMAKSIPRSKLKPDDIQKIFEAFEKSDPNPKGELDYTNNFTLLVAVVLSAQATDVGVNKATKSLFAVADNPQKMLDLGLDTIEGYIKTIGLFRTKAKNVVKLSERLLENFSGEVPDNLEDLQSLAGVGRKTANVVLNIAFGHPTIAVDTHLFRVGNRTGMAPGKNTDEVEQGLLKRVPKEYGMQAHHWLILHGRYICKARKPECYHCIIEQWCKFTPKTLES